MCLSPTLKPEILLYCLILVPKGSKAISRTRDKGQPWQTSLCKGNYSDMIPFGKMAALGAVHNREMRLTILGKLQSTSEFGA